MAVNNEQIAKDVLAAVGGAENVSNLTHCMTRLRFNLKDMSLPKEEEVKKVKGVLGCQFVSGQFQVVIGNEVEDVYKAFCKIAGLEQQKAVDENLDGPAQKKSFSVKDMLKRAMDVLSACMVGTLPVIIASGMMKMVYTLLGPSFLNVLQAESTTYQLLQVAGDAGFYFLPVFVGYTASKKLNTSPLISMLLGAILIHPDLITLLTTASSEGLSVTLFALPVTTVSYSSQIIPTILIVWAQSYVEKLFNRIIPKLIRRSFVPMLTVLVMLPVGLCALGPIGSYIGKALSAVIVGIGNVFGPLSVAIIAAGWLLLVTTGMHTSLQTFAITNLMQVGSDPVLLPAVEASIFATIAVGLAYTLATRDEEEKSLGISCALSQMFGGASEPTIFGILMPKKKIWGCMMIGSFIGGLYMGIMNVAAHVLTPGVTTAIVCFGGEPSNILHGMIGCVISFVATFLLVFFIGARTSKKRSAKV